MSVRPPAASAVPAAQHSEPAAEPQGQPERQPSPAATEQRPAEQQPAEPPARGRGKKAGQRGRRASVPSWDEIMLGNSRQPD